MRVLVVVVHGCHDTTDHTLMNKDHCLITFKEKQSDLGGQSSFYERILTMRDQLCQSHAHSGLDLGIP